MKTIIPWAVILLFFIQVQTQGQEVIIPSEPGDTTKILVVELKNGSVFQGYLVEKKEQEIIIHSENIGSITILLEDIKVARIQGSKRILPREFWFKNPNSTRYVFAPTAIPLGKGNGYYQNVFLTINTASYGLTDYLSIGGGLELISTFAGLAAGNFSPILMFTPKISTKIKHNLYAGGGVMYVRVPDFFGSDPISLGIAYGVTTIGDHNNNYSLGVGYPFMVGEKTESLILMVGGMVRVREKLSFVTENWILLGDSSTVIFSYGVRFFGEKLSVDLGFINQRDIAQFLIIGIPYIGLVVNF